MQMGTRTHHRGQKNSEIPVRTKRRSHIPKEERVNTDEVVKYMSKLPGYLQGDTESNDVLNFGVLDWGRLQKWKKHGRASVRSGKRGRRVVSSTCTLGTVVPNASTSHQYQWCHRCKIDDQVHASSLLGKVKAASRGLQHSSHQVSCTLDPEFIASRDSLLLYKQEIPTCSYDNNKSSPKGRSGLFPEMGNSGGSLAAKESEKRAVTRERERERERGNQCANNNLDGEENHHQVSNTVLLRSRKQSSGGPQMSSLDDNVKVTREVLQSSDGISSSLGLTSQVPLSFDFERDSKTTRHSKTASRIFDQEKKRHTSPPSKRFSFSFGRLSTSFTFKEDSSSAAQPFPSSSSDDTINKSDSMRFDASACPSQSANHPEEKHSRVSPLRRLLGHPLLKSKGSENLLPSKARSTSSNLKPTYIDEKKKQDTSRTRALFQLTTRNGIPLFQFVVDDDNSRRSILGATMKNSAASSFKDDTVQYCTFYSVDEVVKTKRRGGSWLIHGHKEKQQQQQRGFVYNVIGQMRLCNSDITQEQKSEKVSSIVREAVLVDEREQVKGSKEVAAVVIKKKPAEEDFNVLGETIVIIPGGVHSFPEKGAPTPLISRWKSGGLCDCGGWDVGCKLRVYFSNKTTLLHELDHQSFKLFAQEESDQDSGGPVLAMTELKRGIYRVEFDSFLSHLQAFFVCVTVIKCASEEETVSKSIAKSSSPFAPPLSPVGRV